MAKHDGRVTKLDVVGRQLAAAIGFFFEGRDAVVVHTLAAAAHQILVDLGKCRGVQSVVKNTAAMTEPETRRFLRTINYPYNFLKHADRDPEGTMYVVPLNRFTQDFIMDAVLMLQSVAHEIPFEGKVFWRWYVSKYPAEFGDLPEDGAVAKMQELRIADMAFEEIVILLRFNDASGGALSGWLPAQFQCPGPVEETARSPELALSGVASVVPSRPFHIGSGRPCGKRGRTRSKETT